MTPEQRKAEAVRLRDVEQIKSLSEIAKRIGVSPATAFGYLNPEKEKARRLRQQQAVKSTAPYIHVVNRPRGARS